MQPTLKAGDRVLIRTMKRLDDTWEGSIIVTWHPQRAGLRLIKRLQALDARGFWLVGDNQESSTDSRQLGFIPTHLLIGAVVGRIQAG